VKLRRHLRPAALASVLAAAALVAAACGTEGPGGPGGSGGPGSTSVGTLEDARAAWAESGASTGEYRIQLLRTCFCLPILMDATVRGGTVVDSVATSPVETGGTGAEVPDDQLLGMPSTVEDLHALIEKETPTAHTLAVSYDSQGVPLSMWIDPIENAVDDEYGFEVSFASADVDVDVPGDDGAWRPADLPAGASWPTDFPWRSNAQALLAASGGRSTLHLGLWGSSSCPEVPRSIVWITGQAEPGPGSVQARVAVDGTQPAGTACTADYGPTSYAADVPDGLLPPPTDGSGARIISVLVEAVGGTAADPTYSSYVVAAAPSA
jgi:hypothetical protein